VTLFPSKRHGRIDPNDPHHRTADLHNSVYNDVNGDPNFSKQCHDCFDFASLSILHAVTVLLDKSDDKDLQVFRIFEEYLSDLTEQQTLSFKKFRDSQQPDKLEDESSIRTMLSSLHNREDLTALLELRDIEDELKTLDKLFGEQDSVIVQLTDMLRTMDEQQTAQYTFEIMRLRGRHSSLTEYRPVLTSQEPDTDVLEPPKPYSHTNAMAWLAEARARVEQYSWQSKDMQRRCESVQEAYKLLLDMKQKQANIAEASLSRMSAQVASEQNRAIMIFTVFTIIFLPLSFFTSVFGMNTREWTGSSDNLGLHEIFLIAGCVSATVIIGALLLAFNKVIRQKVKRLFYKTLKRWPTRSGQWLFRSVGGLVVRKREASLIESSGYGDDYDLEQSAVLSSRLDKSSSFTGAGAEKGKINTD
jgi:Mg2+ and Co2+ transporter CorA